MKLVGSEPKTEPKTVNVRLLDNTLLVRTETDPDRTPSGLYLPGGTYAPQRTGTVVVVGPGRLTEPGKREPIDTKVGDRITFHPGAGMDADVNGEKLVMLREGDILWQVL